mgnify:CR=1 FL=1
MKQVLVIGGTYFAGRVFSILTSRENKVHLHVVNRGRYPLNNLNNVSQYVCDRHDTEKLAEVLPKDIVFDAVVDFCGYEPMDIANIIAALPGRIKQYIFISTSSVYEPGDGSMKSETDPMLHDFSPDVVQEYILKKCLLELELRTECEKDGIPFTILRPAFIYGPFNYAPRESYFIQLIVEKKPVPVPTDATSKFSFVYVMDVSDIINLCIGNENAYNEVFNLAAPEQLTYETVISELERCNGEPFTKQPVTVEEVLRDNIPLPYPLDEDELYSGEKEQKVLGYTYAPFTKGMDNTFDVFKDVFTHRGS